MEILPDELITKALAWTPLTCHGNLRLTCKHFKSIINSDEFRKARIMGNFVESILVACVHGYTAQRESVCRIWALQDGQWRQAPWIIDSRDERIFSSSIITLDPTKNCFLFMGGINTNPLAMGIVDGQWNSIPSHHEVKRYAAVCHIGRRTIMAGGFQQSDGHSTSTVEIYDPEVRSWSYLPPMPHPTGQAVAGAVGQKIYVAGGMNKRGGVDQNCLTYFQIYNTVSKRWGLGPPIPEQLWYLSGAVVNEEFYVVGYSKPRQICTCFAFNDQRQSWVEFGPILEFGPIVRTHVFSKYLAIEHRGQLFVYRSMETIAYQLEQNGKWSEISPTIIPDPTKNCGLNEGNILAIGSAVFG